MTVLITTESVDNPSVEVIEQFLRRILAGRCGFRLGKGRGKISHCRRGRRRWHFGVVGRILVAVGGSVTKVNEVVDVPEIFIVFVVVSLIVFDDVTVCANALEGIERLGRAQDLATKKKLAPLSTVKQTGHDEIGPGAEHWTTTFLA